jgi:copper(I)-binding protein/transcriptional regulator GlxA family with amidase domain
MKYHHHAITATLLLAAFAAVLFAFYEPVATYANPVRATPEYVCPPCGCDKDKDGFDKPGNCPSCGMVLVEQGSPASRPAANPPNARRRKVAILIFDGVQIIDYTGPWEVFGQAGFDIYTVAVKPDPITTNMGMKVIPKYTFANSPRPDILLVPGGGVLETQKDPQALKWVQDTAAEADIVLSVCNGAYILAKAGLLNGLTATTTAPLIEGLAVAAPNIKVVYDKRFVDNGKVITSGGLSAGLDGALHVVSRLLGRARAQSIALGLEYDWRADGGFVRRTLADKYLNFSFNELRATALSREGSTDHWANQFIVYAANSASAAATLERIHNTLVADGKWVKQDSVKSSATTSFWKFTDENGKPWNGAVGLQPLIGEKNKYLLDLKIARVDGPSRALANQADANQITIRDAWIQEGPPSQKNTAAFMVIENQGAAETELVSARSDVAEVVELHQMETISEVMSMRKLDLISVPAGGKAELKPSGFHLMLIGLNKEIKQGDEVSVTLQFANSLQKTIRVPVRRREAAAN